MREPLYQELSYASACAFAQDQLELYPNTVYFHSAQSDEHLGRYSFIGLDPFLCYQAEEKNACLLIDAMDELLQNFKLKHLSFLPPFQGGLAGFLSYDLIRHFERIPAKAKQIVPLPDLVFGAYDLVLSFDHSTQKAWVISSGFPEEDKKKADVRAKLRLNWLLEEIKKSISMPSITVYAEKLYAHCSQNQYIALVKKALDYIRAGDIFEVNLAQCFSARLPKTCSSLQLFHKLMQENPAPFSAFMHFGDFSIISSSPERFIQSNGDRIETRPIKGTIKRGSTLQEDAQLALKLCASEKDRAENTMIVDLMRNDFSKICQPHSILVEKLCGLESFKTVHHLVSVIKGHLKSHCSLKNFISALFPGGSITGAPKIRAMEIIEELEPTRRGAYCGNALYYGFSGHLDSSILIRTYTRYKEQLIFQAGGAVTLDSDAESEYEETLVKADALIRTLTA